MPDNQSPKHSEDTSIEHLGQEALLKTGCHPNISAQPHNAQSTAAQRYTSTVLTDRYLTCCLQPRDVQKQHVTDPSCSQSIPESLLYMTIVHMSKPRDIVMALFIATNLQTLVRQGAYMAVNINPL